MWRQGRSRRWASYQRSRAGRTRRIEDGRAGAVAGRVSAFVVLFAGLAGATITLAIQPGWFSDLTTGGRGWIAIAIVIFGNWQPRKVLAGALLFGGLQALQLRLQAEGIPLPYEVLLALPYVLTIVAIAVAGRNASYPAALLKPYRREG